MTNSNIEAAVAQAMNTDSQLDTSKAVTESATDVSTIPAASTSPAKTPTSGQSSSLFVRSLPTDTTSETLTAIFSHSYPIKHATAVIDKETQQCKGYGFVTFADADDALRAKAEFNGHVLSGKKLRVEIAERRQRESDKIRDADGNVTREKSAPIKKTAMQRVKEQKAKDRPAGTIAVAAEQGTKLIIRNLPWSIKKPAQLQDLFKEFGKVKKVVLPTKKTGLLAGFGFVIMAARPNAENALKSVNGKNIDGRPVAVDWAVDKETYEQQEDNTVNVPVDDASELDEDDADDAQSQDSEMDNDQDNEDSASDDDKEPSNDEIEDQDMSDMDEEDEELAEKMRNEDRSCTIFVRNLPFTCTDENLEDHFRRFGTTRYARVVMDPATDRSKGTGFVCFYDLSVANDCLKNAPRALALRDPDSKSTSGPAQSLLQDETRDSTGNYTISGRILQLSKAVDKREANRLTKEGVASRFKRDKDKRRLYLLNEGTIPSNSALWDSLSPSEQAMRDASAKQRKQLIDSNPSLHPSLTRLSIRNIPRSITSKLLKALAREAIVGFATDVKEGKRSRLSKEELARGGNEMLDAEAARRKAQKGIVRQAKIVFEGQEGGKVDEATGGGRSRGYGFVEYFTHRSALMGLRWLNGHAVGGGAKDTERKKRLIVEFAIENAQVVGRRQEREIKANERGRNATDKADKSAGRDKVNDKGSRKRKRDDKDTDGAAKENETPQDPKKSAADEKLAKKQRIVQRKRMARRERKKA